MTKKTIDAVNAKFRLMREMVGLYNGLIISGPPGIGKSVDVIEQLKKRGYG